MRNLTGCLQYAIASTTNTSGDRTARYWVDENLLELSDNSIFKI